MRNARERQGVRTLSGRKQQIDGFADRSPGEPAHAAGDQKKEAGGIT
jgi:hypothetical protein